MPHFTKPEEGSWTEHYGLGTGPISYEDSISPEHYELERDAIFRRTWLNVGRLEQLPKKGSFFTKELDAADVEPRPAEDGVALELVVLRRDGVLIGDGTRSEPVVLGPAAFFGLGEVGHQDSSREALTAR